ncbi:DUF1801 domain-containing protein [Pedobacter sp. UBA4863]|uniref:DUF1801 domain-containing protein n=1 Tax=Pedobacter sp. UBA4863 TaxID=1947060 RepID=UPI0025F446BB|nr:DUF1801 domain-containing protein [Pedobacter sp. UBA4863]
MRDLDQLYLKQEEPFQSCLLWLRDSILTIDKDISPEWKYKLPFFYHKGKRHCYLWLHKKYKLPYIGFVDGNLLDDEELLVKKRAKMKTLLIAPELDLPIEKINTLLKNILYLRNK